MQVDFPKGSQCGGHAMQFIFKAGPFVLELFYY